MPPGAPTPAIAARRTQGQQVYPASFPGNQQVFQQQFAAYQQPPQQQQQQLGASQQEQLRAFWQGQLQEVQQVGNDPAEFKNHQLPLARIKKVRRAGPRGAAPQDGPPRTLAALCGPRRPQNRSPPPPCPRRS
jgi:nuclear transcription factor Y gamma